MSRGVVSPGTTGGDDWHAGFTGSLGDVLADYRACAAFARYLVENGGHGSYHAALFGYCYLNDLRHLPAGTERDRLVAPYLITGEHPADCLSYVRHDGTDHLTDEAVDDMFGTVCRHLQSPFERFVAGLDTTRYDTVPAQPLTMEFDSPAFSWRLDLSHASELCGAVPLLEHALVQAFHSPDIDHVVHHTDLLRLVLRHDGDTFRLTAEVDDHAVVAHNDALLDRLREDRDTCCYLQLDDFVLLYDTRDHDQVALAVLQLCCANQYDQGHPGVIERIGRLGAGRDYFVVHSPIGPDPAAVRALVSRRHGSRKVVVRPF